jgi:hypothetical protein
MSKSLKLFSNMLKSLKRKDLRNQFSTNNKPLEEWVLNSRIKKTKNKKWLELPVHFMILVDLRMLMKF